MTAAEPLDLAAIEARDAEPRGSYFLPAKQAEADRRALLAEVKRLRAQEQRIRAEAWDRGYTAGHRRGAEKGWDEGERAGLDWDCRVSLQANPYRSPQPEGREA